MKLNKLAFAIALGLTLTACGNNSKSEPVMSAEAAAELAEKEAEIAALKEQLASNEEVVTADVANEEDPECKGYVEGVCVAANPLPNESEEYIPPLTIHYPKVYEVLQIWNGMEERGEHLKPTHVTSENSNLYYAREDLRDAAVNTVADQIDPEYIGDLDVKVFLHTTPKKNQYVATIEYSISHYEAITYGTITVKANGDSIVKVDPVDLGL